MKKMHLKKCMLFCGLMMACMITGVLNEVFCGITLSDQYGVTPMPRVAEEGDGLFGYISGIAINSSGYVYVLDAGNQRVQVFSSTGTFLHKWGSKGTGPGQFNSSGPCGIAINSTGHVFVGDMYNGRVEVFTCRGNFLYNIGTIGDGPGQFRAPWAITVNASNCIYVSDILRHDIQVFSPLGQLLFIMDWPSGSGDYDDFHTIAFNSTGFLFAQYNDSIRIYDQLGQFSHDLCSNGTLDGQLVDVKSFVVNASGYLFVADDLHFGIHVFNPSGAFLYHWGMNGTGTGQFQYPTFVAVYGSYVYVVDGGAQYRIQVYTATGQYLYGWGGYWRPTYKAPFDWILLIIIITGIAVSVLTLLYGVHPEYFKLKIKEKKIETPPLPKESPWKCPKCGNENRKHSKFCDKCGVEKDPICPKCGITARPGALFCDNCGFKRGK